MKPKDERTLQERADDLDKVLTFSIMSTIRKFYNDIAVFKREFEEIKNGTANSTRQVQFCSRFSHTQQEYRKILGQIDGKFVNLKDILPLMSKWIHLRRHFTKQYRSGKSFSVYSYWYIDFAVVEKWLDYDKIFNTNSDFYTKRQHQFIDKVILKMKKNAVVSAKKPKRAKQIAPKLEEEDFMNVDEIEEKNEEFVQNVYKKLKFLYDDMKLTTKGLNMFEEEFNLPKTKCSSCRSIVKDWKKIEQEYMPELIRKVKSLISK